MKFKDFLLKEAKEKHAVLAFGRMNPPTTGHEVLVNKVKDGRPHIVDFIKNGEISLVFTTVDETRTAIADSRSIRTSAQANGVTYYTTISAARAVMDGLLASQKGNKESLEVYSLQDLHQKLI